MLGDGSSPLPLAPGSSSVGSGTFGGLQQQDRMVGAMVGTQGVPTLALSCVPLYLTCPLSTDCPLRATSCMDLRSMAHSQLYPASRLPLALTVGLLATRPL